MSRTAAGQSWTVHNIGKRIMFGGLRITLMEPDGTVGYYTDPAQPPYQPFKERRYYSKGQFKLRNDKYAGGNISPVDTTGNITGLFGTYSGYWHNGKNNAVSWMGNTVYIDGAYKVLPAFTNYSIINVCLQPPSASSYRYTLVVVYRYSSSGPLLNDVVVRLFGVEFSIDGLSFLTPLLSQKTGLGKLTGVFSAGTSKWVGVTPLDYSGFRMAVSRKFSYLYPDYTSDPSTGINYQYGAPTALDADQESLRHVIELYSFSADYSAMTKTEVYSEVEQGVHITTTSTPSIPIGEDGSTSTTRTDVLYGGEYRIDKIRIEDRILFCARKYTGYTVSYSGTSSRLGAASTYSESSTLNSTCKVIVGSLSFEGSLELVELDGEYLSTGSSSISAASDDLVTSGSGTRTYQINTKAVSIVSFSKNKVVLGVQELTYSRVYEESFDDPYSYTSTTNISKNDYSLRLHKFTIGSAGSTETVPYSFSPAPSTFFEGITEYGPLFIKLGSYYSNSISSPYLGPYTSPDTSGPKSGYRPAGLHVRTIEVTSAYTDKESFHQAYRPGNTLHHPIQAAFIELPVPFTAYLHEKGVVTTLEEVVEVNIPAYGYYNFPIGVASR